MFFLLFFLPLLSFFLISFFGRFLGRSGSCVVALSNIFFSFICSIFVALDVCFNKFLYVYSLGSWISFDLFSVSWDLLLDPLSCVMFFVVTCISFCAHLFSFDYMSSDPHLSRFMSYLSLFTFFMLVLVSSGNLLQLFFGWEGVGLCSFLLINFWFSRLQANKAAIKAMLVNKVGDLFLLFSIGLFYFFFKSVDFFSMSFLSFFDSYYFFSLSFFGDYFSFNLYNFCLFLLFLACMGKSAQIGFHIWLPDAMEGPTPVSSLIHAATMVTAGVFLFLRMSFFFEMCSSLLFFVSLVGSITLLVSSLIGIFQFDIKKIVAYSTCSQLGYMFLCCGVSGYNVAMYHLYNHAFFKALLFLSCGCIIHSFFNEQDFRKMGGLFKMFPFLYVCFSVGSFSLLGFPFLTGFYSKDLMFEFSFYSFFSSPFVYWTSLLSVSLSCLYSLKLIFSVFFGSYSGSSVVVTNIHSQHIVVFISLSFLCFLSIFVGFFSFDFFSGLGTDFWSDSLFHSYSFFNIYYEFYFTFIKFLPLFVSFYCFFFFYFLSGNLYSIYTFSLNFRSLFVFFNQKFFFDYVYHYFFSVYSYSIGLLYTFFYLDKGFFETFGPYGIVSLTKNVVSLNRVSSSNSLYSHYFGIFLFIFFVFFLFFLFSWFF